MRSAEYQMTVLLNFRLDDSGIFLGSVSLKLTAEIQAK